MEDTDLSAFLEARPDVEVDFQGFIVSDSADTRFDGTGTSSESEDSTAPAFYEYVAGTGDVGVHSLGIPGSEPLLCDALTVQQAVCAFRCTRYVAIDRCRPCQGLRQHLRAVLAAGGLRELARLTATFVSAADVGDVVALLTLLSSRCGALQDLSLVRLGREAPRVLPGMGGSLVASHLGRRASRSVRRVHTGQPSAEDMLAMVQGLSAVVDGLPPLRVLRLVDGYTAHPVDGRAVSASDRRVAQPFPPLPSVLQGSLRLLSVANVRSGPRLFVDGALRALRGLQRLEVPGLEDVPYELPPALRQLTVGAVTPKGLVRAASAPSLSSLTVRSGSIYPARARPTDPDPLLLLEDWDVLNFGVTCRCIDYARGRGLLPRRLCIWKLGNAATILNHDMMRSVLAVLPRAMDHLKFMRVRPAPDALTLLCGSDIGTVTCAYMRDTGEVAPELQQRYLQVFRHPWPHLTFEGALWENSAGSLCTEEAGEDGSVPGASRLVAFRFASRPDHCANALW